MTIPEGFPLRPLRGPLAGALFGVDGLDENEIPEAAPRAARDPSLPDLALAPEAAARIRDEIARAGGREVCFLASVDEARVVRAPRAVARGSFAAVLVAARDAPEGGVMLHNHPDGVLEPSEADMSVAACLYEQGLGTAIVDNTAERMYVVVEPPVPRAIVDLDPDALEAILAPVGALSDRFQAFEDRPG